MNIIKVAKQIKDEEARLMLEHPEDYPPEWIKNCKERLK